MSSILIRSTSFPRATRVAALVSDGLIDGVNAVVRARYCVVAPRAPRIPTLSIAALTSPSDFAFSTNLRA
ncbi:hypothetical protein LP416_16070 [Polaromonas sp. P2-4]|nr:hypothetical protein LP416_16070 [Polaromonas sp. P2-4]